MRPELLQLLILGVHFNSVLTSYYYCYDTKCDNYNGTYLDCDNTYNYCEWSNFEPVKCTPTEYTTHKNKVFCYGSSDKGNDCRVNKFTGKARCGYYTTSQPLTEPPIWYGTEDSYVSPTVNPRSTDDSAFNFWTIFGMVVIPATLLLAYFYCIWARNRNQYDGTPNGFVLETNNGATSSQQQGVNLVAGPSNTSAPIPGTPFYPTATGYPTTQPAPGTASYPSAPFQDTSFHSPAPTQGPYPPSSSHNYTQLPSVPQQESDIETAPPSYNEVIQHPDQY